MKLYTYKSPIQGTYLTLNFKKQSAIEIRKLYSKFRGSLIFKKDRHWIRVKHQSFRWKKLQWQPKLYICVTSKYYWQTVKRLFELTEHGKLNWKFCCNLDAMDRPDKIVLYFNSVKELKQTLPIIRKVMVGCRTHKLHHAATTQELGLENGNSGLYVGLDPSFNNGSWRHYRITLLAFKKINREYFEGRPDLESRWLNQWNLSAKHQGPLALEPTPKKTKYIKKKWQTLFQEY